MKDKFITVKSGIDVESETFKEYYLKLKIDKVNTSFLDMVLDKGQKVISSQVVFNGDDYTEYYVEDVSFIWCEDRIIGHQIATMEKKRNAINLGHNRGNHLDPRYMANPGSSKRMSRLDYYCEISNLKTEVFAYFEARTSGKLESEIVIPYEKQIKIQK